MSISFEPSQKGWISPLTLKPLTQGLGLSTRAQAHQPLPAKRVKNRKNPLPHPKKPSSGGKSIILATILGLLLDGGLLLLPIIAYAAWLSPLLVGTSTSSLGERILQEIIIINDILGTQLFAGGGIAIMFAYFVIFKVLLGTTPGGLVRRFYSTKP